MKPSSVKAPVCYELWFRPPKDLSITTGVCHFSPYTRRGEYILNDCIVTLVDVVQQSNLDFYLNRGSAYLAEVIQHAPDGTVLARISFYTGKKVEMGGIEIGITVKDLEAANKKGLKYTNLELLGRRLRELTVINSGGEAYFLMLERQAALSDFESEGEDGGDCEALGVHNAFCIYGEGLRIPVEFREDAALGGTFYAKKLILTSHIRENAAIRLVSGNLSFIAEPDRLHPLAAATMTQILARDGSYMKTWDLYARKEEELLLNRAREIGTISYKSIEPGADNKVKLRLTAPLPQALKKEDTLEFVNEIPLYIQNIGIDYQEYRRLLDAAEIKREKALTARITDLYRDPDIIEVEMDVPTPEEAVAVLSILGDKIQFDNRENARQSVLDGTCANPVLGLLLEDIDADLPVASLRVPIEPLTPGVREKIFKNEPTIKQKEAISVALNTPDIALIQGPPGTGKTTVIAAILERLNEECDKTGSVKGQVLITGFQHDAVNNIISRLSINSLPQIKFGGKERNDGFSEEDQRRRIETWRDDLAKRVRQQNPEIRETERERKISQAWVQYNVSCGIENARFFLRCVLELPRDIISSELIEEASDIMRQLDEEEQPAPEGATRAIYALRVYEASFADDGKQRAAQVLVSLNGSLEPSETSILQRAMRWQPGEPLDFLIDLRRLRQRLLLRYAARPEFKIPKPRGDIQRLGVKVSDALKNSRGRGDRKSEILADFLHELENAPGRVRDAIADYNFVYAATTGQSVSDDIKKAKVGRGSKATIRYDTVIIDEAARVSARDLLIPMSQGEKRIILVGDHRQLPQMIDDEVVTAMEASFTFDRKIIEASVFGYLFERLQRLERRDGVKRTVTLDAQYRMHPVLGNFVSKNFYERHNTKEAFRSPLEALAFTHSLPGSGGKPAMWLNLPFNNDGSVRIGTSYWRKTEAFAVIERFLEWYDWDRANNPDEKERLSFGIISFYRAQCDQIEKELVRRGVKQSDKLRIGTVDSFQGMEFDVVFLSIVRCMNPANPFPRNANTYEKKMRGLFGFLLSENRLCVSMSRQKRLLVVAGDGDLADSSYCRKEVPALSNFYDLCRDGTGVCL